MARRASADELRKKAQAHQRRKGLGEALPLYAEAARAFESEDKTNEAIEMLSGALSTPVKHADAASHQQRDLRRILAAMLARTRRIGEAIGEYEELLKIGTPDAQSLQALAQLYVTAGKTNLATDRLRRAIDRSIAEGDIVEASRAAGRLAELLPESFEAAVQYASLLRNVGDDGLVGALDRLMQMYQAAEKLSLEVSVCREILEIKPGRDDVKRRLASLYTRILEMDPHDDDAWQGLRVVDPELAEQIAVLLMDELTEKRARSKAG
jgi:tetratricopeptide (TPR) repeat protein